VSYDSPWKRIYFSAAPLNQPLLNPFESNGFIDNSISGGVSIGLGTVGLLPYLRPGDVVMISFRVTMPSSNVYVGSDPARLKDLIGMTSLYEQLTTLDSAASSYNLVCATLCVLTAYSAAFSLHLPVTGSDDIVDAAVFITYAGARELEF
jgi:hypothetical protein